MQTAPKVAGTFEILKEKIATKTAKVGIVGLGYVGLPLATEFAKAGFTVVGIDVLYAEGPACQPRRVALCRMFLPRKLPS